MITDARKKTVRCAIYTRKSTNEGLEQEFNTLDAQREAAEAYIASQKNEGWVCLPARYDDGGHTGANVNRPALQRLLEDIRDGKIDAVVTYKVDRLSRSLLDFSKLMEIFEKHDIAFVSVTQQFSTSNSMGRLTLNILLSFAQFEREIISERTRDKMSAARRKGKYIGGAPILGYDIVDSKLVVNETEAEQVRAIYRLYLEQDGLLGTVRELQSRDWRTKSWTTKSGKQKGGSQFAKNNLHGLLTNVTYRGQIRYRNEVYAGEHEGIVDPEVFDRVQTKLRANRQTGTKARTGNGAMLSGLVRCQACGCGMTHSWTRKKNRQYRYYVCVRAQKEGRGKCPNPSIPAGELERFVVDEVRTLGRNSEIHRATFETLTKKKQEALRKLSEEQTILKQELLDAYQQMRLIAGQPDCTDQIARLNDRIGRVEQRVEELRNKDEQQSTATLNEHQIVDLLMQFDPVWQQLTPKEQSQLLRELIEAVEYDGAQEEIEIRFRPEALSLIEQNLESRETEELVV